MGSPSVAWQECGEKLANLWDERPLSRAPADGLRPVNRPLAKNGRTCINELLGDADFLVRSGKLFPSLCDHELCFLELGEGIRPDFRVFLHNRILAESRGSS